MKLIIFVFLLRILAFVFLLIGAFLVGDTASIYQEDEQLSELIPVVYGLLVLVMAFVCYLIARHLLRRSRSRTFRPEDGSLEFAPADDAWLPDQYWRLLPDPVQNLVRPRGWVEPQMPTGPVPPDEVLRRLWLVRAHLISYFASARNSLLYMPTIAGSLCFVGTGLLGWFSLSTFQENDPIWKLGFALALAFVIPTFLNLKVVISDLIQGRRRYRALRKEQQRLMAFDAQRPGGAQGGPEVKFGFSNAYLSGGIYQPPPIERY